MANVRPYFPVWQTIPTDLQVVVDDGIVVTYSRYYEGTGWWFEVLANDYGGAEDACKKVIYEMNWQDWLINKLQLVTDNFQYIREYDERKTSYKFLWTYHIEDVEDDSKDMRVAGVASEEVEA